MKEDGPGGIVGPSGWSVITWLLVVNVAVFLVQMLFPAINDLPLALSLEALGDFKIWTFFTYQFAHYTILHILCNMIGLYFLGKMLLNLVGAKNVLTIYLLGGVVGAIFQLLFALVTQEDAMVVGASASVLAIILAVATLIPHQSIQLLLFFIIPVTLTMRQLALIVIVFDALTLVFQLISGPQDGSTAVMAHFGGMLLGWAYVRYWLPSANDRLRSAKSKPRKKKGFGIRILKDDEPGPPPRESGKKKPFVATDVDAILDKINEKGFQSLTDEERKILERSSRKLSDRIDNE